MVVEREEAEMAYLILLGGGRGLVLQSWLRGRRCPNTLEILFSEADGSLR
jgi:hypothetical protein